MGISENFKIIEELQKIAKVDWNKADSIFEGFKRGASLVQMQNFYLAKTPKQKALLIKKYWL